MNGGKGESPIPKDSWYVLANMALRIVSNAHI